MAPVAYCDRSKQKLYLHLSSMIPCICFENFLEYLALWKLTELKSIRSIYRLVETWTARNNFMVMSLHNRRLLFFLLRRIIVHRFDSFLHSMVVNQHAKNGVRIGYDNKRYLDYRE